MQQEVRVFSVLRRLRQRQLLQRCLRRLWAWGASAAVRRRVLKLRVLGVLKGVVVTGIEDGRRAAAARRGRLLRGVLKGWQGVAAEEVSGKQQTGLF